MKHRKFIAVLMMALCLIGTMPLSTLAFTPLVEGATYQLVNPDVITVESTNIVTTPIVGLLDSFTCNGSPDIEGTATVDVLDSEVTHIGYFCNFDYDSVVIQVNLRAIAYIPILSNVPIFIDNQPATLLFTKTHYDSKIVLFAEVGDQLVSLFVTSDVRIILTDVLESTDMSILKTTLTAFSAQLSTQDYGNWILGGYNSIVDVFINNAKIQYVTDNPIFIIALVVFAMAIALAVATLIFKFFRRY